MVDTSKHLVFFDGECGLCDQIVQILLKIDRRKMLSFAPLQGGTAKSLLKDLPDQYKNLNSLIFIENFQTSPRIFVLGQAALRILWLIGGIWSFIGIFSFLPPIMYNWIYRLVAKNRYKLFGQQCLLPKDENKDRFLP